MPIIRKDDVTPERPVIVVLYGTPGCGKTSLATTSNLPILIDTDRGYDRAVQRIDTLAASSWQDIEAELDTLRGYKTIIVDTAKAMLDDFLAQEAIRKNYKLATNSLKRFGQMGDDFKLFVNTIRSYGADLVFICHDKEVQEGDIIKHSPDCTGQSKDLLLRIADQVGYITKVNGRRTISFEPMDNFIGKNVAQIQTMQIPDMTDPRFPTAMADIINSVRQSIQSKTEAQRKANDLLKELRDNLDMALNPEDFDACLASRMQLPAMLQNPFAVEVNNKAQSKGFIYDKAQSKYVSQKAA